jgi:hypothetical protein
MAICKGCKKEIHWGINVETGRRIPLEIVVVKDSEGEPIKKPQLYRLTPREHEDNELRVESAHVCFVSHSQTCPKADQSKR